MSDEEDDQSFFLVLTDIMEDNNGFVKFVQSINWKEEASDSKVIISFWTSKLIYYLSNIPL